ncbi:hypothetical protein D3C73_1008340 [compost metagenome]
MSAQPARVEDALMAIQPLDAQATEFIYMGVGCREMLVDVDDFQHLLAGHGVDALCAWAVVSQPLVMERADTLVGPCHHNTIRQGLHATERADQRIRTKVGKRSGGVHGDLLRSFLSVTRSLGQCIAGRAGRPAQ